MEMEDHGSPCLSLQVAGKHALLFDDDSTAAFINSEDALLPWKGQTQGGRDQSLKLMIDRYDVRHLLEDLSASALRKRKRKHPHDVNQIEADLDLERYRDLHHHSPDHNEQSKRQKSTGEYQNVPFSYGTGETGAVGGKAEEETKVSNFKPPFSVPENVLSHLPPTEKTHQIIARTAKFVSEHGGQSEIILRVKQGSNPIFGFLLPDHHLHIYFRFLVDHPEVLDADKTAGTEHTADSTNPGEGLSLLGSVYGTGDDEDEDTNHLSAGAEEGDSSIQDCVVDNTALGGDDSVDVEQAESSVQKDTEKDKPHATLDHDASVSDKQFLILEVHRHISDENALSNSPNSQHAAKHDLQAIQASEKLQDSALILEPPLFLKRVVRKMVEFIVRNGKEFEGIIVNQDRSTGRFPFLLPSNQYHPYYLKVLGEAQQGKLPEIDSRDENFESLKEKPKENHKTNQPKRKNNVAGDGVPFVSRGSTPEEMNTSQDKVTLDREKKKKFKIVISGIKKDGHDQGNGRPPGMTAEAAASAVRAATNRPGSLHGFSQASVKDNNDKKESGMSVDAAAAVVMAATRGFRKFQQGGTSETGIVHGGASEKTLKGISEESDGTGSVGLSSHHVDVSNPHSRNDGMALPQSGHHSGISASSSKQVIDSSLARQQSGGFSGASGSNLRLDDPNLTNSNTSVAKVMLKSAELDADHEADSSEACLSQEEKVKAERLKRARMFAALIKSGHHVSEDTNVQSTSECAVAVQNDSGTKGTASTRLGSPKDTTSYEGFKVEECTQTEVVAASKQYGSKSTTKQLDRDRHSHHHRHHIDHHKSLKPQHDNSDDDTDGNNRRYESRHKHTSETRYKDSISERHLRKRHHKGNFIRSSDDGSRRHKHRSCSRDRYSGRRHRSSSRDRDSGKAQDHYESKEDGHRLKNKETNFHKSKKRSSGKEHTKESSWKEHSSRDDKKEKADKEEKAAVNSSNNIEVSALEIHKSPIHGTEVPDDLRAKVRAMLLANL